MKTTVLLAILVAIALAVAWFIFSKPAYPLSEEDAKKFFLEDLQGRYPSADVREVTEIIPLTSTDGSPYFQLQARVTNGMSTPCPERIHVYYDYPPKNFEAQPPAYITKGCKVCLNVDVCVLAYPEEAIIASHTYPGAELVGDFVRQNAEAEASPQYFENFENQTGVWQVNWSTPSAGTAYEVLLSKNQNRVLEVRSTPVSN